MNRGIWTLFGFLLLFIGFTSLVLSFVGVNLTYLKWLETLGPLIGFVIRLIFILTGFVIIYLSKTDWRQLEEE